jgi:hypothetical protein
MWLQAAAGIVLGAILVGGAFWFAFRRVPERREDGGLTSRDASYYMQNDWNGPDNGPKS